MPQPFSSISSPLNYNDYLSEIEKAAIVMGGQYGVVRTAEDVVKMKFHAMANVIHHLQGPTLLATSKRQARQCQRSWFLCTINLEDWLQIHLKPLVIQCRISPNAWRQESNMEVLRSLHTMNLETQYMLTFEIIANSTTMKPLLTTTVIIDRKNPASAISDYEKSWVASVLVQVMLQGIEQPLKWICALCSKVVSGVKNSSCGDCQAERYCSRECQVFDWPSHKLRCHLLKQLREQRTIDRQ